MPQLPHIQQVPVSGMEYENLKNAVWEFEYYYSVLYIIPLEPGFDLLPFHSKWHHLTSYQTSSLYVPSLRGREGEGGGESGRGGGGGGGIDVEK